MAAPNKTRYALLGLLTLGAASGYDLKRRAEESVGNFWSESYGQIYPVLRQLEQEGLVAAHAGQGQGRRARTVYEITGAGQAALEAWLAEPATPQPVRLELLLKLFFGRHVAPGVSRGHVQAARERAAAQLRHLEAIEAQLRHDSGSSRHLPYWLLTVDYGRRHARATLDWCDAALAGLPDTAETPGGSA